MNTSPISISESATIAEAIRTLTESHQNVLVVVDDEGKLTGLLTETDLFRSAAKQQKFSES